MTPTSRRSFLGGAAGAGVVASAWPAMAAPSPGGAIAPRARALLPGSRVAAFENGRELDAARLEVEGAFPADLKGVFHRNGPAMFERGDVRYRHWFDGDGFVQRWRIENGGVRYRSRFIQTSKFRTEAAAGAFLFPVSGGGVAASPSAAFSGADSANPSNTSIVAVGAESWALWEGGSAMRIDPESLDTLGLVRLGGEIDGAPFSAHPRRGEDGRMWNIGSLGQRVLLYRLDAAGALESFKVQPLGQEGYVHDFLLTARSLVVVQCSTETRGPRSLESGTFGTIRGVPDKPMRVHVFDRETFDLVRQAELPSGFAFHFGNAWEEGNGTIHFDVVHYVDGDQMLEFFKPLSGQFPTWQGVSHRVTLPPAGAPRFERMHARAEFPKINPRFDARRHRYVYATGFEERDREDWFDAVIKIDLDEGRNGVFSYGPDWMVEEHVFVPRPGGIREDDGWVVGTALNWARGQTALTVFDAARPDVGPLARAWLDQAMPLGLHGDFRSS
jgi:carotenoid cleavage dioxygenase